ncbi:MAG TPA: hypothetical protein PKK06_16640 [Phycisphaerae bacterium]|nr:hypothetical protein [Phycisphaerae bacterium]
MSVPTTNPRSARSRPVGHVEPRDDSARQAWRAWHAGHAREADRLIAALPDDDPLQRAWRALLLGHRATARGHLGTAAEAYQAAAGWALEDALGNGVSPGVTATAVPAASVQPSTSSAPAIPGPIPTPPDPASADTSEGSEAWRLAACALHELGVVQRREDLPEPAYRVQHVAYVLRVEHGSPEELCESATDLGLDAALAGRHERAVAWLHLATAHGRSATEDPHRLQAVACTHLASLCTDQSRHVEAVNAARQARLHWAEQDPTAVEVALADLRLGHALLRQAEALSDAEPETARLTLQDACELLTDAREGLLGFGNAHAADVRWCREQQDFAERLRATLAAH